MYKEKEKEMKLGKYWELDHTKPIGHFKDFIFLFFSWWKAIGAEQRSDMIWLIFFFFKFVSGLRVNCKQNQEDQLKCYYKNAGKKIDGKKKLMVACIWYQKG